IPRIRTNEPQQHEKARPSVTKPMPLKPKRRTALKHSSTRLLRDDYREVNRLCNDFQKGEGTVIQELVHEALKVRRIRRAGRDETTAPVRDAQREIVQSELAEMKVQLKEILDVQDR